MMNERWQSLLKPILAVLCGIALGLILAAVAGDNPLKILGILVTSALGSPYDLGMSLFYATPLIFTGLAVAVPFQAGLFNIGGEGQMTLGICAATALGIFFPELPRALAWPLTLIVAFAVGALWGAIPGWMKARRGAHEVITTIMLNFIAAGLASWITLGFLRNTASMNPESRAVGAAFLWPALPGFGGAPLSSALILGGLAALAVWLIVWRSVQGFELRALGQSVMAADFAGIDIGLSRIKAMALGGGLAGLAAISEVFGNAGKFKLDFSAEYGFMGIAVALLGRGRPLGIIAAALLFGCLHKGAADLDFESEFVTRDLALVMQSFVILTVAADALWQKRPKIKVPA